MIRLYQDITPEALEKMDRCWKDEPDDIIDITLIILGVEK